jgi:acyl carrier protein
MTADDTVTEELMALLREHRLVASHGEVPTTAPIVQWLDSLGRLELVDALEERWGVDLEEELLGAAAREIFLSDLVERIRAHA